MTHGRTSFFISHRLASTRFCDRIIFVDSGKIAEEGTHDELLKTAEAMPICLKFKASTTAAIIRTARQTVLPTPQSNERSE